MSTLRVDNLRGQTAGTNRYIVQVVQSVLTTRFTSTSTSYAVVTGASASITPSSTNNKVLVTVDCTLGNGTVNNATLIRLRRDSSDIGNGTGATELDYNCFLSHIGASAANCNGQSKSFLDSPNSTSSLTYDLTICAKNGTATIGGRGDSANMANSTIITLMEIAQ